MGGRVVKDNALTGGTLARMSQLEPIMAEEKGNALPPACASPQPVIAPPTPAASPLSSLPPACASPQSPIPPLALSSPPSLATIEKEDDAKDDVLEGPPQRQRRQRHRRCCRLCRCCRRHLRTSSPAVSASPESTMTETTKDEGRGGLRSPPPPTLRLHLRLPH